MTWRKVRVLLGRSSLTQIVQEIPCTELSHEYACGDCLALHYQNLAEPHPVKNVFVEINFHQYLGKMLKIVF
jgi:hypothetical protein